MKSETFSDEWHVRVYSHAANACHRTASERQILVYPSRMIGYPSRVFPPRDVLSSLKTMFKMISEVMLAERQDA